MAEMVHALFRYAMHGKVELAWTDPRRDPVTRRHNLDRAALFELNDLDTLVERALAESTVQNQNLYISAGLRHPDHASRRAKAKDVIAVVALKADCDTPGCLTNALKICAEKHAPPSLVCFTGREPHLRGSLWWVLEEPEQDLARVEAIERAIARLLASDPSVVNPDRVMRLAGSVAWPLKAKRSLEMTGIYQADTRAAPYTLDELQHAFSAAAFSAAANHIAPALDFSAARSTHDLESLIAAAAEPHQWHRQAVLATAHLIGRGTPPEVVIDVLAPRLTMPGYIEAQTREELAIMVRGAVAKGWLPEQPPPEKPAPTPALPEAAKSPFVSLDDMLNRPPPTYIVDGYLTEGGLSVLWGASGAFKSFVAIDLALSVASGQDWHGRRTERRPCLYVCAEGQYGFGVRALAWRQHKAPDADLSGFYVLPAPVNFIEAGNVRLLTNAIRQFIPDAAASPLIVIDTLARNFGGGDENATRDMNLFIASAGLLQSELGAHVLLIHHTGKDDSKGERGSYSLRGAVDTSLKLVRDGKSERISLEHFKQKEGPECEPMPLRMAKVEATHPVTGEIISTLAPVLDAPPAAAADPLAPPRLGRNERTVLAILQAAHPLRFGQVHAQTGIDKGTLGRVFRSLIDKKLVAKDGESYFPVDGTLKDEE